MNFDRLYFARHITLTQLGIFGIARTLADMISLFAARCSSMILFPLVAAMRGTGSEIRYQLRSGRRWLLLIAAVGLGLFTALGDRVVGLLYDARYAAAGQMLPILAIGTWFAVLSSINDSILVGLGHARISATANFTKLLTMVIGLPIALAAGGLQSAVMILSACELVRYLTLWSSSRRDGLGFARDDVPLTVLFLISILLFREVLHVMGLTSSLSGLYPMIEGL